MKLSRNVSVVAGIAAIGLIAAVSNFAGAQPAVDVVGEIGDNEGFFVDAKTFKIARGKAKGDPTAAIAKLGAKEVGPGAIIFRHGDKLYMVEAPRPAPSPQAMKDFQDKWAVSYAKAMKDFQENWNQSYMKDKSVQDEWNVSYMKGMKDFQENWNVSYMKAAKGFQDEFAVSYMKDKNFQDNWHQSYMKTFQDSWATNYMK